MREIQRYTRSITNYPGIMILTNLKCFAGMSKLFISVAATHHHFTGDYKTSMTF